MGPFWSVSRTCTPTRRTSGSSIASSPRGWILEARQHAAFYIEDRLKLVFRLGVLGPEEPEHVLHRRDLPPRPSLELLHGRGHRIDQLHELVSLPKLADFGQLPFSQLPHVPPHHEDRSGHPV